ncbi:MAG: 1-(5-phosphoribosyl)-5-[(5-phosphoribosylamino)methylideneamino]imidazole-4-carboxamide isomerase [Candidatus Limnocylindrales bacterium]
MRFDFLPAVDLRGGAVVRLRQGDFAHQTVYGSDPVAVTRRFVDEGACWIHLVDLDGARIGAPVETNAVAAVMAAIADRANVEIAGGLRTAELVQAALAMGAARAVVGSAAIRDPSFVRSLVARHGSERIVVALDVRDGRAIGDGWRAGDPGVAVDAALGRLADAGATTFEVTAIARDGLLGGPDLRLLERLVRLGRGSIVASGGIAGAADIAAVRAAGCSGAIVGRALYEGRLSIADALSAASAD